MRVANVPVGSRIVDSLPFSMGGTPLESIALKREAVDGLVGYLGPKLMTPTRLAHVLSAGLGFMPVTLANEFYDGPDDEIAQLKLLGIPQGTTVWLDVEGEKALRDGQQDIARLMKLETDWAKAIIANGWIAGLYVGAPQPHTGPELYQMPFTRYWLGIGRCVDRNLDDAYPGMKAFGPAAGYCMRQDWHNNPVPGRKGGMLWRNTGVFVDTNSVQCDHKGRLPTWVIT